MNRSTNFIPRLTAHKSEPDTVVVVETPEEKVGFFKKIFGGKKKKPEPVEQVQAVDSTTIEKETIKQEIAEIEQKIQDSNKELSIKEKALLEQNIQLTEQLNQQIDMLEISEQKKLMQKTQEADRLAAVTYKRLALFTIASIVLMLFVLFLFLPLSKPVTRLPNDFAESQNGSREAGSCQRTFLWLQ